MISKRQAIHKYDDNEPRDDHGRWTDGGSGGGGGVGAPSAVHQHPAGSGLAETAKWLKTASAKEVIAAVASSHKTREAISVGLQSLVSHATGLDQSTWKLNEDIIDHAVHHIADIAAISSLQARDMLRTTVSKLRDLRKSVTGKAAAEDDDEVLAALEFLLESIDQYQPKPSPDEDSKMLIGATQVEYKIAPGKADGLEFILSDQTVDRMGDVIEASGWVLDNFKNNPVALWDHGHDPEIGRKPIGRWTNLRIEGGKLKGKLDPARGVSPQIDGIIALIDGGFLPAVSVGFAPIEGEPLDSKRPYDGTRYTKQELLECSVVAVGANPAALQLGKSLKLSQKTMSLLSGEHADVRRRDVSAAGGKADLTIVNEKRTQGGLPSRLKVHSSMKTLAQRIEDAQNELVAKRDKLVELNGADELDLDAIEALNDQIGVAERTVAALKASESKLGAAAGTASVASPAIRRPLGVQPKEVKGVDLLVRAIVARGVAHFSGKSLEQALEERYPGHEATAVIAKTAQTIGTTTVSGWASELVQTVNQGFLEALMPYSIYPALRARGIGVNFDGIGTVSLPSRTAGGAGGGFVAEGQPIRVGRITTAATTMTPKKLGVIVPFSRELTKRSTPAIEALVRQAILEDTAVILDSAIVDATASSTARPAGLLNGVSAAATGYGGGDYQAVVNDLKNLLAPFYAANAGDNITVLMNPAQGLALSMMPGPGPAGEFGWSDPLTKRLNIVESTNVPANRLIALRNSDFATAMGDAPEFDVSEQATVHMEDTTPLEIVSATGPTTANPVRSFFQTATIGVRMLMDVSWKMRRTGMVQWIDTTTW